MTLVLFFVFSLFLQGVFGEMICEELPIGTCSFSIASSGKRCLLENYESNDGTIEFQCKTSEVVVKGLSEWIESDECTSACGLDRASVGISSDSLFEPMFTVNLCSAKCYQNCPNIVDLYYNLALGEGVHLSELCKVQRIMPRRAMSQLLSSGAALGPISITAAAPVSATISLTANELSETTASAPSPM